MTTKAKDAALDPPGTGWEPALSSSATVSMGPGLASVGCCCCCCSEVQPSPCDPLPALGVPSEARERACFAARGLASLEKKNTGARASVLWERCAKTGSE